MKKPAATMALTVAAVFLLAGGALTARVFLVTHGHVAELLEVTVRIVDRGTGRPLADAVVASVRHASMLDRESLDIYIRESLESPHDGAWRFPVCATRTTAEPETLLPSSAYVTRFWFAGIRTSKEVIAPRLLLVEHPRFGRKVVPIATPIEPGAANNTWRVDLGTVAVP